MKYLKVIKPHLINAFNSENAENIHTCNVAINLVGDISSAIGPQMMSDNFCDIIIVVLLWDCFGIAVILLWDSCDCCGIAAGVLMYCWGVDVEFVWDW